MSLRRRLASQSALIFAARIFGAGITFLVQAAIARYWGADLLGEYLLLLATINLIAVALPLGFQAVGTYFPAEYAARGDGRMLMRFMFRAYAYILGTSLVLTLLCYPLAPLLGEPGLELQRYWLPSALLAFGTALVFFNGALFVGLKRPIWGITADTLFRPLMLVTSLGVAMAVTATPHAALAMLVQVMAVGYAALALVHLAMALRLARAVPRLQPARPAETRRWFAYAMPLVLTGLAQDFYFDIDLLLLAGHMPIEQLAVFGVCARVFALMSFGVVAAYSITIPDMFESGVDRDREGLQRKIDDANLVSCGLALALGLVMAVAGPLMLMLFGPDFAQGYQPLLVLCLALVLRSAFGPASLVLSMHERPLASLPAVTLGIVVLVVGNVMLVDRFGLMGAACAALVSITSWSAAQWYTALRLTGMDVSLFARFRRGLVQARP